MGSRLKILLANASLRIAKAPLWIAGVSLRIKVTLRIKHAGLRWTGWMTTNCRRNPELRWRTSAIALRRGGSLDPVDECVHDSMGLVYLCGSGITRSDAFGSLRPDIALPGIGSRPASRSALGGLNRQ